MKNKLFFGVVLMFFLLQTIVLAQTTPKYYWYYYTIDSNGPVGVFTKLIYDANGMPAISYREDKTFAQVKFARFNGESSEIMVVDDVIGAGQVAMALDNQGMPRIIYHTFDGTELKYSSFNGHQWSTILIDDQVRDNVIYTLSIQVDLNNRSHILYTPQIGSRDQLSYIVIDNMSISQPVRIDSSSEFTGKWNSLLLDTSDRPLTAYFSDATGDLSFARLEQNQWQVEKIEEDSPENYQGYYCSLCADDEDNLYISFQSHTMKKIRFAYGRPGSWTIENITDLHGWSTFSTPNPLALDEHQNPYIAFHDSLGSDLLLAYKEGTRWYVEEVDTVGIVGEYASLAISPQGMPAISYYDRTHGHLRLAIASLEPPTDTDGDNVPDYIESLHGSDFLDLDTDDDGLMDGEEDRNSNGFVESNETDPKNPDTDGDGIWDGVELGRAMGISAPSGLKGTDLTFFKGDEDPNTMTNPLLFDTDRDFLGDGIEDNNKDGRVDIDESDPNQPDTDGDGILDGLEIAAGSSPLDLDSDDDGISDSVEDSNLNGIKDIDETDASLMDTDRDGLPDGLEIGIVNPVPDPDGPEKLKGTNLENFIKDSDPGTITNPLLADTDNDGLLDGLEDKNRNGRADAGESDPLNADTDNDKLSDGIETKLKSDPLDLDSDDDGLEDSLEDVNLNGIRDADETSAILFDTDGDGLSDGLEVGRTQGISDPDGEGHLKATDFTIFIPDQNSLINSNPLLWDTDDDCLSDGEEDVNLNGAVEEGETHFLISDTDEDGLLDGDESYFSSDPLDFESKAIIHRLYEQSSHPLNFSEWTVVDDGLYEGPSEWLIINNSFVQTSNIWGQEESSEQEDVKKPGTYIWFNAFSGTQYKITCQLLSSDDDELGVMFHYQNRENYYRFSMNKERGYLRLVKVVNNVVTILAEQNYSYTLDRYIL